MISSSFNTSTNTLETEFCDDILPNEVIKYLKEFETNTEYPRKLKTLVDATNANFKFNIKDLLAFNTVKNQSLKNYDIVISAIIISTPFTAALSSIYSTIAKSKKYKLQIFSTHEGAIMWLSSFGF